MEHKPSPPSVNDCRLFLRTHELEAVKARVYSRGSISRGRRNSPVVEQARSDPSALARAWSDILEKAGISIAVFHCETPSARSFFNEFAAGAGGSVRLFTNLDPLQTWSAGDLRKDISGAFCGLSLFPTLQHFHVYDRRAYGLYEMCEQLDVPIMIDFGITDSCYADLRFANPLDLQPVARDFPGTTFIIPAFGRGFFRELLILALHCPNVYADTSGDYTWLRCKPNEPTVEQVFRRFIEVAGPRRLIFGTGSGSGSGGPSYQADRLDMQKGILDGLGLEQADLDAVMTGNLERLLLAVKKQEAAGPRARRLKLRSSSDWSGNPPLNGGQELP